MTHFCAVAFTESRPDEEGLEQLLWPWSLHNLGSPHVRRLDFFQIGGRFEKLLDPRSPETGTSLSLCQRQKRAIPIDALRERAVSAAAAEYDDTHRILAGRPLPDIAELTRLHGERGWSKVFHADPSVQIVKKSRSFVDPWRLAALAAPREVVLTRAEERAFLPYAFVADGAWHTYDGFCLDEDQAVADAWRDEFQATFDAAAPDTWLSVIDCHC